MTYLGRWTAMIGLIALALLALGCGGTELDHVKLEATLEQNLEQSVGQKVTTVDCPSGVAVDPGKKFDCSVVLDNGEHETATIKILNEDADTELAHLQPDK